MTITPITKQKVFTKMKDFCNKNLLVQLPTNIMNFIKETNPSFLVGPTCHVIDNKFYGFIGKPIVANENNILFYKHRFANTALMLLTNDKVLFEGNSMSFKIYKKDNIETYTFIECPINFNADLAMDKLAGIFCAERIEELATNSKMIINEAEKHQIIGLLGDIFRKTSLSEVDSGIITKSYMGFDFEFNLSSNSLIVLKDGKSSSLERFFVWTYNYASSGRV